MGMRDSEEPFTEPVLLDRDGYYAHGVKFEYGVTLVGASWNLLIEKQRIILLAEEIGRDNIGNNTRVYYGDNSPVRFASVPEVEDNTAWMEDAKRSIGPLIVQSLAEHVIEIDRHVGSADAPVIISNRIKEAAGRHVKVGMVEFWRKIVNAELGPEALDS